jgi:hypothetical protein
VVHRAREIIGLSPESLVASRGDEAEGRQQPNQQAFHVSAGVYYTRFGCIPASEPRVTDAREPFERLIRLRQILSLHAINGSGSADVEPRRARERHTERIRQLTLELQHGGIDCDEVDAVAMRLLLNEYAATLTTFRDMARQAESHMAAASGPVKEARRYLKRQEKRKRKREAGSAGG